MFFLIVPYVNLNGGNKYLRGSFFQKEDIFPVCCWCMETQAFDTAPKVSVQLPSVCRYPEKGE